ncbi:hypothetical protein BD626DRAFT_508452, partial [Schizophyllum amplum]
MPGLRVTMPGLCASSYACNRYCAGSRGRGFGCGYMRGSCGIRVVRQLHRQQRVNMVATFSCP